MTRAHRYLYHKQKARKYFTPTDENAAVCRFLGMRRFTRLTNGFSKKIENHAHAIALHYMFYNFVRIHKSLRCTPAMAAGVTNRLSEISDMVALLPEPVAKKRGPYKKKNER